MNRNQSFQSIDPIRTIKKILLSVFVVVTFSAYAVYERISRSGNASANGPAAPGLVANSALNTRVKDGTFTGSEVDAYYGWVKVQTIIQGGRITDVHFLEYPQDRRTSQRINSFAVPNLQQEAIQAQTANVDIISGATLTSEAFRVSLQAALDSAKN